MSSVRVKRYVLQLSDEDEVHVMMRIERRRLVAFALNLRTLVGDTWREVVRYDTAHGRLHVHRFWLPPSSRVTALETPTRGRKDYTTAFRDARKDLEQNWQQHRGRIR